MDSLKKFSQLDLNLLTVFLALMQTKQVTAGAKLLGLSQPAMSHALARLRVALGDPLFVKTSKEMAPTPRAMQIAPLIQGVLSEIEQGLLQTEDFAPAKIDRIFHIKTTDFLEALILPSLLRRCAEDAPGVRISLTSPEFQLPRHDLEDGRCDLAIGGFFGVLPDGFYQQHLFDDHFESVVSARHPRLGQKKQLSLDTFCGEKHLLIAPSGDLHGSIDKALKVRKKSRAVVAGLSCFMSSGWIVEGSELILTGPSQLLQLLVAKFDLRVFSTPLKTKKISMYQVWHERHHHDPAHKWLRSLLRETISV